VCLDVDAFVSLYLGCLLHGSPSVPLDGDEVPLLLRDDKGECVALLKCMADGYVSMSSKLKGVSAALGNCCVGMQHTWNSLDWLFKILQLKGKESGGNFRENACEVVDKLMSLSHRTIKVPYGQNQAYEFRVNVLQGRDLSLLWTETATGSAHQKVRGRSVLFLSCCSTCT
jgi:hypothetical protein